MKAYVSYNDFIGTVSAQISNKLGEVGENNIKSIGEFFKINQERFEIKGLSIYGTNPYYVSLICIDKDLSTNTKQYVVKINMDLDETDNILSLLFENLSIVLCDKFDSIDGLVIDYEGKYQEFH